MVMSSMQLHPLFALAGITTSGSSATSTSSSASSGNNSLNMASMISMPNGSVLPSGLSISITPAVTSASSSTPTSSSAVMKMDIDAPCSPMSTGSNNIPSPTPSISAANNQQQALRALANGLTASLQSATANMSNSTASANTLNQASLLAAASKLMELNASPVDDIVMQEITQRLVKMNQELWQHASVSAAGATTASSSSGHTSTAVAISSSSGHGNSSSGNSGHGHGHGHGQAIQQQQQANELKLAEKLVNELAVQQSTRNAFHLNERTLQECWSTLQRVSCMIFMHKSAMQLQQQQQQQQQAVVAQQQQGQSHHGPGGPGQHLHRPGSVSSIGSESGVAKPHQCQQCLKAFSSNHQLVQHIRVHTGEKPYKCSYCDRRFKQLSHVQQHTRLHTGERPYKCHVHDCGRAFIQLSNLQQHLRNHDAQLERSKNRPFHCNICGKGFATESSLRTHTSKVCKDQHAALIGGPNAVTCPICHKLFLGGEALMEHMKHTHKDPNASGVATKRRTANHPCPICGKHYVNEGSLRKHLTCHPETAQLTTSLRMWPCSVCQAVFTHESGLLTHMEQMRMDPKHQFAAQYVLSRAAAERRERENVLTAAAISAMAQAGGHHAFGNLSQNQSLSSLMPMGPPSPSGSESSGRLSSPLDTNASGLSHPAALQHTRMSLSSPVNGPLDARITNNNTNNAPNNNTSPGTNNSSNANNNNNSTVDSSSSQGQNPILGRKDYANAMDKYEAYEKMAGHHHGENNNISSLLSGMRGDPHLHHAQHGVSGLLNASENGPSGKYQAAEQAAMKMAAMLGQGHGGGHGHGHSQADLRNLIHHHTQGSGGSGQMHGQDMMGGGELNQRLQAEALIRTQAAEALRLAVVGNMERSNVNGGGGLNLNSNGTNGNMNSLVESIGNHLAHQQQQQVQQHQHQQLQQHNDLHRGNPMSNGHNGSSHHSMHHHAGTLNQHQLNSLLSQQTDLSEALLRLDPRSLGFQIPAHNS